MAETPVPHAATGRSVGRGLLWPALLALTIVLTVVLQAVNVPLKTPAAPQGIVSYEFAGTTAAAQSILDSWDAGAKVYAGFSLGLDYLYMPAYALTIGLACAWAARVLGGRRRWLGSLGRVLAFGLGLAALLDAAGELCADDHALQRRGRSLAGGRPLVRHRQVRADHRRAGLCLGRL